MGTLDVATLDALATSLRYPDARTSEVARFAAQEVASVAPALAVALNALAASIDHDRRRMEERYTGLFDLSPVCALHVGWHLFGEDYARGMVLSHLRVQLREAGVSCAGELPDHLPILLELLARLDGDEDRGLLAGALLLPALAKMAEAFPAAGAAAGAENARDLDPYPAVLRALPSWLEGVVDVGPARALAERRAVDLDVPTPEAPPCQ